MHKAKNNPQMEDQGTTWQLIAEFSLEEPLPEADISAQRTLGLLLQVVRDLGMPPSNLKRVEASLAESIRKAWGNGDTRQPEAAVWLRLYSQIEPGGRAYIRRKTGSGGWGYYLLERGQASAAGRLDEDLRILELYIFQEGD